MAAAVANEELEKGLKQARKKPRNFLLVGTGSKPLKLLVQKKPIKPAEIADAKKEAKATAAITGVCQGDGSTLTFYITEETSFKTVGLRVLITEETGLTVKAEFQVVPALPEVAEDDLEDGNDAVAPTPPPTPPAATAPPQPTAAVTPPLPPPPAPPPPPPGGLSAAQLTAALNKLTPAIQQAVAANPAKKAEILKPVADFQARLKANDLDAAKELLVTINRSLSSASAPPPPVAPPPPPPQAPTAAKPPVAPPSEADAKPHLEAADEKAQAEFEKRLAGLSDRYVQVLRGQPSTASQLRVVMDFANGKAEQNDFTGGLTALQKLSGLLDDAEVEIEQKIADAFVEDEDETRGVVAFRKSLLLWSAARDSVEASIQKLQQAVAAVDADVNFEKLEGILAKYNERLDDALIDCINAESADDRKFYHEQARDLINEYQTELASDDAVIKTDENPFIPMSIGKTLTRALKQIAAELK